MLVAEDDDDIREALADVLRFADHPVRTAANGEAALDCVLEHGLPSAILLDLLMPKMSGGEFLRVFRRSEEARQVPVIVLTGVTETGALPPCFARLLKPFDMDELLALVARAVASRREGPAP